MAFIIKKGFMLGLDGLQSVLETAGLEKAAGIVESAQENIDTVSNIIMAVAIFLIIYLILIVYKMLCKLFCWRHLSNETNRKNCQKKCGLGKFCFRLPFI